MVINRETNKIIVMPLSFILLLITLLTASIGQAANITVTMSRNPVALDDSFHLVYEADSDVDDEPDFAPIYKYFDVLNSGQSTNMRFINGSYSLKKSWDLAVIAKNAGKFTIPPIAFGKDISPAIQVTVTNNSSPNSVSPNDQSTIPAEIFLESVLDKKQGWVQSQFIYTLRLLRTVSIASASLTEPETNDPDAIIQALGENKYQTTRNGTSYEVFERRYAIFPQKSGQLKISPATFEGRINATQARTIFDQFRMSGQLKRLRSNAVAATVKANPNTVNLQDWVPASNLQLSEEWSDDVQAIKTGEPITRTITITAEGLTGVQLPDLNFSDVTGLKQYPDKPVVEDQQSNKGITGSKQFKIALIPTKPGDLTLPEIKLQWWNTKTNQKEFAIIPQTTISAIGSSQVTITPNSQIKTTDDQNAALNTQQPTTEITQSTTSPLTDSQPYWKWLTLLFAIAWLFTLFLLFKKKKSAKSNSNSTLDRSLAVIKSAAKAVERHALNNDANKTKTALISWAQKNYSDKKITNLTQITELCSSQLTQEIRHLNQTLYSPEKSSWQGRNLLAAFKSELSNNQKEHDEHASSLKPLYNN